MKRLSPNQQEAIDPNTKPERLRALATRGQALERKVAQNPNTPADLLLALSKREDRKTKEGLAQNPSTPPGILFPLAGLFAEEFLRNPVVPLLLIEDPSLRQLPEEALVKILRCEEVPEYFFTLAAQKSSNPKLRLALAQNPKTPTPLLEELAHRVREHAELVALLENPGCSPKAAAILVTRELPLSTRRATPRPSVLTKTYRELLAKVGLCGTRSTGEPSEEELRLLASLGEGAQRYVAAHPKTPTALLEVLSTTSKGVCEALAKNPNTPLTLIVRLAQERPEVGWLVAQHPRLPSEQLAALAATSLPFTRESAAKNPNTPESCLVELLFDIAPGVRAAAAKNPNTPRAQVAQYQQLTTPGALPAEAIEALAAHQAHWIRALVAQHPHLPLAITAQLSKDQRGDTKRALLQNAALSAQVDLLLRDDPSFATFAANSRDTPPSRMVLATHAEQSVRLALAKNPKISADLLAALLDDPDSEVQAAAALNEQRRDIMLLLSHRSA